MAYLAWLHGAVCWLVGWLVLVHLLRLHLPNELSSSSKGLGTYKGMVREVVGPTPQCSRDV